MAQSDQDDKRRLFYPHASYHGEVKPENLLFNANFQEFVQKVGLITALETGGKISPEDAYQQIKKLWKQLKKSKKTLNIGDQPSDEG